MTLRILLLTLILTIQSVVVAATNMQGTSWLLETDYAAIKNLPIKHDVLVAVIDTGINYNNPYLADSMYINPNEIAGNGIDDDNNGYIDDWRGWDFVDNDNDPIDDDGHGTGVSAIITAKKNDYKNHSGLFPGVKVLNIRLIGIGKINMGSLNKSIRYAVDMGAKVINCSFAISESGLTNTEISILRDSVIYAVNKGAIVVAGAGNNGHDIFVNYPAGYPESISVAGLNSSNDSRNGDSSYGESVDYSAQMVFSDFMQKDGTYKLAAGTSLASPVIASVIARLLAYDNTLTRDQVLAKLNEYSTLLEFGSNDKFGRKVHVTERVKSMVTVETKKVGINDSKNSVVLEFEITKEGSRVTRKVLKYAYVNSQRYSLHKEIPL